MPRAPRAGARVRKAVVVLPLVPVMPDHAQLARRVAVEARRRRAHGGADVGHHHLGHVQAQRALHHERGGAALDGVRGEVVPVGPEPLHTEEERPRLNSSGAVGE